MESRTRITLPYITDCSEALEALGLAQFGLTRWAWYHDNITISFSGYKITIECSDSNESVLLQYNQRKSAYQLNRIDYVKSCQDGKLKLGKTRYVCLTRDLPDAIEQELGYA